MIFSRISIENLGVFRGQVDFDLTPVRRKNGARPIILFGGMNGAGKTTVFEAFKLALYGPGAFWPPPSRDRYETEMRNRLSRHPSTVTDTDRASVELEIQHTHMGRQHRFIVRRKWSFQTKAMKESLEVLRDGIPLDEIEQSLWQEFVWDLIPPGLSRLFFFDGEKIQALAEDESGTLQLADSFRSLVGLDLVDRLSGDLDFIVAQELRRAGTGKLAKELASAQRTLRNLETQRASQLSERARLQSDIDTHLSEVETSEHRIAAEGGGWAKEREDLLKLQASLLSEITTTEQRLRELAAGDLPFALVPELCARTAARLSLEVEMEQWKAAATLVRSRIRKQMRSFDPGTTAGVDPAVRLLVTRLVEQVLDQALVPPSEFAGQEGINDISQREAARVREVFEQAASTTAREVSAWSIRREEAVRSQQEVSQKLSRVPAETQLAPMVSKFNALHARLSKTRGQAAALDAELAVTGRELETCRKRIEKITLEAFRDEKRSVTLDLARRVGAALKEFQSELTRARIGQVATRLEETFASLSRKRGWLGGIRVDPKSFAVALLDRDGRELPKERLAAGEKQIYAVALLWALAKASGRNLPFIIDTPLGRLDSHHRRNLVSSFLPFASEQVIVFSTDTEIDRPYFDVLAPHIARSFHLTHDEGLGLTRSEQGYFWRGGTEVPVQ